MKQMEPTFVLGVIFVPFFGLKKIKASAKGKHIGIKYHVVRQSTQGKEISVWYASTQDNLADPFTKILISENFEHSV